MAVLGIDAGARFLKVVLLDGSRIVAQAAVPCPADIKKGVEELCERLLREAGLDRDVVEAVGVTGSGREMVEEGQGFTEVSAVGRGAFFLRPSVRTVVDVGAEASRVVRLDGAGRVRDFVLNDRCAAGAGIFLETMARVLEVDVGGLAALAMQAEKSAPINAQCVVFAESEVVGLIHARVKKEEIALGVHEAMARRVTGLLERVGVEPEVLLVGGLGRNKAFVHALEKGLKTKLLVLANSEFVCAIGAALLAQERPR